VPCRSARCLPHAFTATTVAYVRVHSDCLLMARGKARNKKHMPSASRPNRTPLHPSNAPWYHHAHWSHAKQHVHTAAAAVAAPPRCAHHQLSRQLGCEVGGLRPFCILGFPGFLCDFCCKSSLSFLSVTPRPSLDSTDMLVPRKSCQSVRGGSWTACAGLTLLRCAFACV
jgi:hypothetical protein